MEYTADQIRDMTKHIEGCCGAGDPDLIADMYSEDLPPEEHAEYIRWAHHTEAQK
ncbi:hypothetical protein [Streptosporangium saharense]|uniref:Uncharacterized protein n=1 Tax=Streptosporangium saharense TaxID=1706840 RepID=A0A7W7VS71_9ACTN|nr:hypothetical protein [Streptosporangium saharense]MBB4920896.1 hypothetical protein [Streptosporangium saharense]